MHLGKYCARGAGQLNSKNTHRVSELTSCTQYSPKSYSTWCTKLRTSSTLCLQEFNKLTNGHPLFKLNKGIPCWSEAIHPQQAKTETNISAGFFHQENSSDNSVGIGREHKRILSWVPPISPHWTWGWVYEPQLFSCWQMDHLGYPNVLQEPPWHYYHFHIKTWLTAYQMHPALGCLPHIEFSPLKAWSECKILLYAKDLSSNLLFPPCVELLQASSQSAINCYI